MSKKWASNEKDQLLVENFKKFMEEGDFSADLNEAAYISRPGRDAALGGAVAAAGTLSTAAGATIGGLLGGVLGFLAGGAPALPGAIGGAATGGTLGATAGFGGSSALAKWFRDKQDDQVLDKLASREITEANLVDFLMALVVGEEENTDLVDQVARWFDTGLKDSNLTDDQKNSIRFERDALENAAREKNMDPVLLEKVLEALEKNGLVAKSGPVAQMAKKGSEELSKRFG